jgi:hypothetical protein
MKKELLFLFVLVGIIGFSLSRCKKKEDPCVKTAWYQDHDGDGRGNPDLKKMACEQPEGYVDNNTDTDDSCIEKYFYEDKDGDGRGNVNVKKLACHRPDGFVSDSTDTDDTCIESYFYEDKDGDGLGNPDVRVFVCEIPDGFVTNKDDDDDSTPCDKKTFYEDADDDGLGNPLVSVDTCMQPYGYVANSDDPDDLSVCDQVPLYRSTSPESLVFAIVGDLGDEGDVEESVANLIKSWNPAYIVTCGDNDYATNGTEFNGYDQAIGRYFHEYIYDYHGVHGAGSDTWRFFPTIGDHDGNGWEASSFSIDNYLDFFSLPNQVMPGDFNTGHGRYYQFRWGDVHIFVLNTWNWSLAEPDGANKDSEQAEWLREQACASDALFKIVISHWPPYGSNKHWHEGDSDHLRNWRWKAMGIDVLFAGNDHGYEKVILPDGYKFGGINNGGFHCITTAGGGATIYQCSEPYHPGSEIRYAGHGASKITISGNTLTHEYITPEGNVVDSWTISK